MEDRGIKALEEAIEQLRREAEELRASRTRLVLAADADRRRIERELHDGAQQDLVGLAVNLQQARRLVATDPAAAGALVDEMRRDIHEALDRSRALAQRIHPPQLEAGGLPRRPALGRSERRSSRPYRRRGERASYPQEVSATVYLCCVAALERLVTRERRRRSPSAKRTGRSRSRSSPMTQASTTADADLAAMRDRVEALGGRLTIASGPGGGTRIAGSLPIARDASRSPRGRGSRP